MRNLVPRYEAWIVDPNFANFEIENKNQYCFMISLQGKVSSLIRNWDFLSWPRADTCNTHIRTCLSPLSIGGTNFTVGACPVIHPCPKFHSPGRPRWSDCICTWSRHRRPQMELRFVRPVEVRYDSRQGLIPNWGLSKIKSIGPRRCCG